MVGSRLLPDGNCEAEGGHTNVPWCMDGYSPVDEYLDEYEF